VAVAQVVDPDLLDPREPRCGLERVVERVLGEREDPAVLSWIPFHLDVLLELLGEKSGHGYDPLGLLGLRLPDDVAPVQAAVRLRHADGPVGEIEIIRLQRQQLALPQPAPVEGFESVEHLGPVDELLRKPQVLLGRPELHLLALLLADPAGLLERVGGQAVVPDGMVENRRELVLDRPDVGLGELLAVFVSFLEELVLPVDDVSGCDVHDPHSAEKRNKLVVDHVLLAAPGGLPEPRPHVFGVDLDELLEGHAGRPRLVREEVPLPFQGFGFALEPSLRRVDCLAVAVGVVEPDEPSAALAVFSDGHG